MAAVSTVPVPTLVLSDALLFANPSSRVLKHLETGTQEEWRDALVLATPFWDPKTGPLARMLDLDEGIPPLAAASIRFDSGRQLQFKELCDGTTAIAEDVDVLTAVRRVKFQRASLQTLTTVAQLMPNLTVLNIEQCKDIVSLNGLESLSSLEELSVSLCKNLSDVTAIAQLSCLARVAFVHCGKVADISPLAASASTLKSLDVSGTAPVEKSSWNMVATFTSLESLRIGIQFSVTDVSFVKSLVSLRTLNLSGCMRLTNVAQVVLLLRLETLILSHCTNLQILAPLASLSSTLRVLDLSNCRKVSDLSVVAQLPRLEHLSANGCSGIENFSSAFSTPGMAITDLRLHGFAKEFDVSAIVSLSPSLKVLDLRETMKLSNTSALSSLTHLEELYLGRNMTAPLTTLSPLVRLRTLDLNHSAIVSLEGIEGMTRLEDLNLNYCEGLEDISAIASLTSLSRLQLKSVPMVLRLSPCATLTNLEYLDLSGCSNLSDVSALLGHTCLRELHLSGCSELSDISGIASLSSLEVLDLSRCDQTSSLAPLTSLHALREIDLGWESTWSSRGLDITLLTSLKSLQRLRLTGSSSEALASIMGPDVSIIT